MLLKDRPRVYLEEHVSDTAKDLEFVEEFSSATDWEEIDEGFRAMYMDTDQDVSTVIEQYFSSLGHCSDVLANMSVYGTRTIESVTLDMGVQYIGDPGLGTRPTYVSIKHDGNQEGWLEITGHMKDMNPYTINILAPRIAAYIWSFAAERVR